MAQITTLKIFLNHKFYSMKKTSELFFVNVSFPQVGQAGSVLSLSSSMCVPQLQQTYSPCGCVVLQRQILFVPIISSPKFYFVLFFVLKIKLFLNLFK